MKLDVLKPIEDIDGNTLKVTAETKDEAGNIKTPAQAMVLADVLINVALAAAQPNKPYSPKQHVIRYELALNVHKARKLTPPVIEISPEIASEIKDDLARIYMPIVAGQILRILDPKLAAATKE